MTIDKNLITLQEICGYRFKDQQLLVNAMTHSSYDGPENYERLEFLGDRVIGLAIAEKLYKTFPEDKEGNLAKRHAALVQGKMLARIARRLKLGKVMMLSDAERAAGGAENENILADGVEALIGAMYLDSDMKTCCEVITHLWGNSIHTMKRPPRDPKTALQEWAQARGLPLPHYELVGRDGPDHAPIFEMSVSVEGYPSWSSKGKSRRTAEKDAALMLLAHLEEIEDDNDA